MKTRHYISLLLGILLGISHLYAQNSNRLYIPDLTALPGSTASIPIYVENTTEIVAVQFILQVPEGSSLKTGTAALTNRSADHTVTMRPTASREYTCIIYSPTNSPLKGRTGKLMTVDMQVGSNYAESSTHAFTLKDVVLSLRDGSNVLSAVDAGTLTISKCPDLSVKNVNADKTTCAPGETLGIGWQVENIGDAETGDGWSEQISLVQTDGTSVLIGTTHYDETLSPSGSVSRQATVTLPQFLGLDGNTKVQVQVIPLANTGESEGARGNNIATTATALSISKQLTLTLPTSSIEENYAQPIRCTLARSGNRTQEQTFALSATADSRLTIPQEVTIPAGQSAASFYIQIKDNTTLDNSGLITVTASGNGYKAVNGQITIEDNEYPDLTLTASKSQVTEGETFQLTVTLSRASTTPLEVTLTSENSKRFTFPSKVTIPAGETTAQVTVVAVDDELPSLDLTNAFTASASGYNKGEVLVILKDNDLPVLELMLTPSTVSEGAGVVAVAGVLKRTTNTNSKITVKLSDDANGGLYFGNRTIELAKGVEEVHFNFGPVDNAIVDGDRNYTITAAVWLSSCSCGASGESAGYVTAQLQVLDNDGAALNLTSSLSTVKEGGKTMLTVSRNTTDNSEPLTVTLQSDYDNNLTYNHTITIPAGLTSTIIEVTSKGNDIQGDSHTVVFTAQAEGYATGTCYLMVTDQTLPDARISSITADVTEAEVGTKAILTIVVINEGAAELPAEVPVKIYCRGDANAVGTIYTSEAMPVGSRQTLTKTIVLPTSVGTQNYYAVVNESNKIQELSYNNNTSADVAIATISPFSIAVSTDKTIYKQGEKVIITGQLTGNGIAETDIDIYLVNDGARQVQTVKTDAQGAFSYEWQLYAQQSGHFVVGACYPGEGSKEEMTSFDVYGLKRTENNYITCDVILGDIYDGDFNIINPSTLGLTGVKAEVLSSPDNCNATASVPSTIEGGQTVKLSYQLQGTAPTAGNDWEEVKVRVTANEGVTLDVTLYFYCRSARAKLMVSTNNIVTTMTKGKTREYSLQVTNIGCGNTGKITLALPSFIKSLSGNTLPALDQNSTIDIPLTFTPTEEMQLNIPVTGYFGINCENGEGSIINFKLTPVSEETGTLIIDVCDENTYYTAEAPHLKGAQVVVRDYSTNATISQGQTDSDGELAVILPSGYYNLFVTAENHDSYNSTIFVDPGIVTRQTVNLSIESIKVNWSVEETEVEDEYEIVTTVKYETNVPTPVVELSIPNRIYTEDLSAGESLIFYATLTNKGLITAFNTSLTLPSQTDNLVWEPLAQNEGLEITPQQSILIPFKVTRMANDYNGRRKAKPSNSGCHILTLTRSAWKCGSDWKWHEYKVPVQYEVCPKIVIEHEDSTRIRHIVPIDPPIIIIDPWWIDPVIPKINVPDVPVISFNHCIPCLDHYFKQLISCVPNFIPIIGCGKGGYDCTSQIINHTEKWIRNTNCTLSSIGCSLDACDATPAAAVCTVVGWIVDGIQCLFNLFTEPCHPDEPPTSSRRAQIKYVEPSYITVLRQAAGIALKELNGFADVMLEVFGDSVWVKNVTMEEQFDLLTELAVNSNEYFTIEELKKYKPAGITESQFSMFVERLNNSTRYEKTGEDSENRIHQAIINVAWEKVGEAEREAIKMGYANVGTMFQSIWTNSYKKIQEQNESVCATISLQFSQTMTMTRQAFRGTLTVFNGNEDTAMQDLKLKLNVTNRVTGQVATSHEFHINSESLDGFNGELDLGSGWTLGANETGTATILFIPTKYAAPTEPVEWSFGGTLSYIDPFTGLEVTRDLYPVTLTVKPSPELDLSYFMQRDVYGDDPLTEEIEPMEPAEFSLLINNIGNGDATNVKVLTNQPKIIDNEKGLMIEFELLGSQLNGGDSNKPQLGGIVGTDFGTIPAHSQVYAQWWLTSSLLGHFTDYDVQATHVTSFGNPDLSLLNEVSIHELIRSIKVDNGSVTGFVANDLVDAEDTPDVVYFTDGTTADVAVAANAIWQKQSNTEYLLTITPSQPGWNYGHITDPTFGRATLIGIRRQSDGKEINLRNFWQTDRTLRDGNEWLYENNLHFVDQMTNSAETYILTFEPRPDMELQIASFDGVPEEGVVLREPLQKVTVTFNKAIDAETFTNEDITLHCQGTRIDIPISITPVSDTKFMLDLSQLTAGNGYYVLTVQTAGITDFEGFAGSVGKTATWIQFTEATTLALSFYEKELIYGDSFTEPRVITNSLAIPAFTSTNPLVASVDSNTGDVTINAVGTTQVNVSIAETSMSDAAQTSYRLTVLQPEGTSEVPVGVQTVSITIPEGQTMTTFCSPWPIDFSDATDKCRAYVALTYHDDIVVCKEVAEAKGGVGLLIAGKPGTYTFPVRTSFNDPMENLFVGTLAPTYIEEMTGNKTNLGLKANKFLPLDAGVVKANKAYLPIEMENGEDAMSIALESLTGLRVVTEQGGDGAWYHISGMKVNGPSRKGIYIRDGRKVIVK